MGLRQLLLVALVIALASAQPQQKEAGRKKAATDDAAEKKSSVDGAKIASGQEVRKDVVKKGSDGRPLLFGPNIELCKRRKYSKFSLITLNFKQAIY